jgi:phosphoribosylamine--glycine ligase
MARFGGDVMPLLLGAARGDLSGVTLQWERPSAMAVVLAAPGYPGNVAKDALISGLEKAALVDGVEVLHAGTKVGEANAVLTNGGRVLCVTGAGADLDAVAAKVYEAVGCIRFDGMQYRDDIGHHARSSR